MGYIRKILNISMSLIRISLVAIYTIILSLIGGFTLLLKEGDKKYFFFARHWARTILKICGVKVKILGLEKIKTYERNVYVSNHASWFDIWALQAYMPGQLRFIGKKEIVKIPIFGWIWKYSGNIPIDRTRGFLKSLRKAKQTITNGRCLIIYPEGTRTRNGKMQHFKRGTFSIALESKATIVPVTINGSYSIYKKGSKVIYPGIIDLVIHNPIKPNKRIMHREKQLEIMNDVEYIIRSAYIDQ